MGYDYGGRIRRLRGKLERSKVELLVMERNRELVKERIAMFRGAIAELEEIEEAEADIGEAEDEREPDTQ